MIAWTERSIASYLARFIFQRKYLLLVPNCQWPGSECDLLAISPNLRVIDVEIKISRSDLKADAKKDKWFHSWNWREDGPQWDGKTRRLGKPRQWPARVWKHYYCLPRDIWTEELSAAINPVSGVLLVHETLDGISMMVARAAKPDRTADKITAEDAIDIARLASLRMWDAYTTLDQHLAQQRRIAA